MFATMNHLRIWISRSFWTGAALTLVSLLALLTAAILMSLGDRSAATGVWGVLAVTLVAWLFNFITLVSLLAWQAMHGDDKSI